MESVLLRIPLAPSVGQKGNHGSPCQPSRAIVRLEPLHRFIGSFLITNMRPSAAGHSHPSLASQLTAAWRFTITFKSTRLPIHPPSFSPRKKKRRPYAASPISSSISYENLALSVLVLSITSQGSLINSCTASHPDILPVLSPPQLLPLLQHHLNSQVLHSPFNSIIVSNISTALKPACSCIIRRRQIRKHHRHFQRIWSAQDRLTSEIGFHLFPATKRLTFTPRFKRTENVSHAHANSMLHLLTPRF